MALIYDNKVFRNLQEQVQKNKQDIREIKDMGIALDAYGIKVIGEVDSESELPDDFSGDYGDAYLVGTQAPYDVYVWSRGNEEEPDDHFIDVGPIAIIGPRGPKGDSGIQGVRGPEGIGWVTYPTNVYTVPYGTLAIDPLNGDLYKRINNPVSWVNIGNIKGQQGIQGQQGPQGEKGDTGEQGPQGPQGETGASYQVIGTYAATANLPDPTLINPGSAALVGSNTPYELYIVVGATQDAQQWVDAGVFNEQVENVPIITINTTKENFNTAVDVTLTSDQIAILQSNIEKDILLKIVYTSSANNKNYWFLSKMKTYIPSSGTNRSINFMAIVSQGVQGTGTSAYMDTANFVMATYLESSGLIRIYKPSPTTEITTNKITSASNLLSNKTSTTKYPCAKAVYDYINPIDIRTPKLTATMNITGVAESGGSLSIQVYAASDTNANWIAASNGSLNTNYTTISQICSYLQTTLNAIGAAPITNKTTIKQLIYLFASMQMFTGTAITTYAINNNPLQYARFLLYTLDLSSSSMGINSFSVDSSNPVTLGLDLYLDLVVFGIDGTPLTDSDNLSFTITVH